MAKIIRDIAVTSRKRTTTPAKKTRRGLKGVKKNYEVTGSKGKGRTKKSEQDARIIFVTSLVANRLSYPEIAKALSLEFGYTTKGAYNFLNRMSRRASKELENYGEDLAGVFSRLVVSIEHNIKMAMHDKDWKTGIAGNVALSKIFGFDKGLFLAAVAEARKERRQAKQITSTVIDNENISHRMHDMSHRQLMDMLDDDDVGKYVDDPSLPIDIKPKEVYDETNEED